MPCARGCCPSPAAHFRTLTLVGTSSFSRSREREFDRDQAAYRRLRANGVTPRTPVGAARLEATARTAAEVERRPPVLLEELL